MSVSTRVSATSLQTKPRLLQWWANMVFKNNCKRTNFPKKFTPSRNVIKDQGWPDENGLATILMEQNGQTFYKGELVCTAQPV